MTTSRDRARPFRRSSSAVALAAVASLASVIGCSSAPPPQPRPIKTASIPAPSKPPEAPPPPQREPPPAPSPLGDLRIPSATWAELPNGLKLGVVETRALPIIEIRVAILGGRAADGERPGLAALTSELLRSGGAGAMSSRDELTRIESLGADLSVRADIDRITLRLAVTKDLLSDAIDLLGDVVLRPQLSPAVFAKLKKRATDRAAERATNDADWSASMVLFRDLFALPVGRHPYASFDATPDELSKITAMDCRAFWGRHFVPRNTFVVVAGDTSRADVKAAVTKAFGRATGGEPPVTSFTDPVAPESLKITLVDRPKSPQSALYAGMLGPARSEAEWPSFTVASRLLGGDGAGFIHVSLRDGQVVESNVASTIVELAGSPAVYYARAGAAAPQTGLALKAMLEHIGRLSAEAPAEDDIEAAKRSLAGALAVRFGSVGDLADTIVDLRTLNLWDDAVLTYRKALLQVTPVSAARVAAEHLRSTHAVVVVVGDADLIGPMLSHFADVKVVDPTNGFQRLRTIAMNADAPLKPSRTEGESR